MRYVDGGRTKWEAAAAANPFPSGWSEGDPGTWNETKDNLSSGYGACILTAARHWAEDMEAQIAAGRHLEDIAKPSFRRTNDWLGQWSLTGFQYGMVVELLSACWIYGDALRRWHNIDIQIHNEGERANELGHVLNPALLRIAISEPHS